MSSEPLELTVEEARRGGYIEAAGGTGTTEHDEQVELFKVARLHEAAIPELRLLHSVPNGGYRTKAAAGKMKAEGQKPGVPDVCLPVRCLLNECGPEFYSGLYIEMKLPGRGPRPEQRQWLGDLAKQGFKTVVCRSWIEAWNTIVDYLGQSEHRVEEG